DPVARGVGRRGHPLGQRHGLPRPLVEPPHRGRTAGTPTRAGAGMSEQRASEELSRATAVQVVGTTLSRVTGFGRVVALAYVCGLARLADAYNLANVTPNIVYELVLGGVLSATLVPVFVERFETDDDPW